MTLFDIGLLVFGWGYVSAHPGLRTRRSLAFLIALSVPFVAVGWLVEQPSASIVQIAIVWTYVVTIVWFPHVLAGMSASVAKVDRALHSAYGRATKAQRKWVATWVRGDVAGFVASRTEVVAACDSALRRLDEIQPPDDAWHEAVSLLRKFFLMTREQAVTGLEAASASGDDSTNSALMALNQTALNAWAQAMVPHR